MKTGFMLFVSAMILAAGCAEPSAEQTTASENMLATVTNLDAVTPADVAAAFATGVNESLAACVAAHPEVTSVTRANLSRFIAVQNTFHYDLKYAVEGLLDGGASSVTPAEVAAGVQPWAERVLASHADASGLYAPPAQGLTGFHYAELAARETAAHAKAKAPGGKSFDDLRAAWRAVQTTKGGLDSSWLLPRQVSGEPTLGEIEKTMRIPFDAHLESWGYDAVDDFADSHEGPDGAPAFAPLALFLESNAIQKRWYFKAYSHEGSTNVLVVLDEHDQLWGMQMGYSE